MKAIQEGKGLRDTARTYNVPVETLRRRVVGKVGLECHFGPTTVLIGEEGEALINDILEMADIGYGLGREDIMQTAYVIAEKSGQSHPFKNGMAGRGWLDGFLQRFPRMTLRTPHPLSLSSQVMHRGCY